MINEMENIAINNLGGTPNVVPNGCSDPITINGNQSCHTADGITIPVSSGRVIMIPVTVEPVCPNKNVSLTCILCEKTTTTGLVITNTCNVVGVQVAQIESGTDETLNYTFVFPISNACSDNNQTFVAKVVATYNHFGNCPCPCSCER